MPLNDYTYWLDANLPPKAAGWLHYHFGVKAQHVYDMIGLLASDESFYLAAQNAGQVIILTKDADFIKLQDHFGAPPKIIWIKAGNLSNEALHDSLKQSFSSTALQLTDTGSILIELTRS